MHVAYVTIALVSLGGITQQKEVDSLVMEKDHLRQRLAIAYDGTEQSKGLSYDPHAKLEVLDSPELEPFLPKTTFFKTTLNSPHFEYRSVPVLLCYTPTSGGVEVLDCLSPVFTDVRVEFLDRFSDLPSKSGQQRRWLALGIGKLLAAITERGDVRKLELGDEVATIQLWHGKQHWRNIEIRFANNGAVERVLVEKPKR